MFMIEKLRANHFPISVPIEIATSYMNQVLSTSSLGITFSPMLPFPSLERLIMAFEKLEIKIAGYRIKLSRLLRSLLHLAFSVLTLSKNRRSLSYCPVLSTWNMK